MKILKPGDPKKAPHLGIWRCSCGQEIETEPVDMEFISGVSGDKLWRIDKCETCGQNREAWTRIG